MRRRAASRLGTGMGDARNILPSRLAGAIGAAGAPDAVPTGADLDLVLGAGAEAEVWAEAEPGAVGEVDVRGDEGAGSLRARSEQRRSCGLLGLRPRVEVEARDEEEEE